MSSTGAPPTANDPPLFPRSGGPLDPNAHPFIVSHFMSYMSYDLLCLLRAVSKDYRNLCDRELAYHLRIVPKAAPSKDSLILTFTKPEGVSEYRSLKIPGLPNIDHDLLEKGVPDSVKRILSFVRVLDIHNSGHHYYCEELPTSAEYNFEQISRLCGPLAPYCTHLDVLKLSEAPWSGALPFKGHTLAVNVGLEMLSDDKYAIPPICPFSCFETLNIDVCGGRGDYYEKEEELPWVQPPVLQFPSTLRNVALQLPSAQTYVPFGLTKEQEAQRIRALGPQILLGVLDVNFFLQPAATCTISMNSSAPFDITSEKVIGWVEARLRESGIADPKVLGCVQVRTDEDPPGHVQVDKRCSPYYPRPIPRKFELLQAIDPAFSTSLRSLENVFLDQTDPFTANGVVRLEGALERVLLYYNGPGDSISSASLPLSEDSCAALLDAASPSPFGRGSDLVFDEEYRLAREIKSPGFTVTGDVLAQSSLLNYIQTALSTRPLYATISKLNVYPKGGFFKPHRDTPRGDNHLGTLTLCLPSSFTGGELVVRHKGEEEVSDWASTAGTGSPVVPWTFLYSNCEHEVLPVTSGTRITVAYDVFIHEGHKHRFSSEATLNRATAALSSALDDDSFLINGGVLAFGLQHEYSKAPSSPESDGNRSFLPMLKGIDATWVECVAKLGLAFEFVAAYKGVDSKYIGFKQAYRGRTLAASRDFFQWSDAYDQGDVKMDEVPVKNLHWVTVPGAWGIENHYTSYGNEPQADVRYVSVAIFAYVGPPGERTSFNETTFKDAGRLHTGGEDSDCYD